MPSAPAADVLDISRSPAYAALFHSGLIVTKYQLQSEADIQARPANSSPESIACVNCIMCCCCPLAICVKAYVKQFTVEQGTVKLLRDGRGGYEFASAGVHQYKSPWLEVLPGSKSIQAFGGDGGSSQGWIIRHGDRCLTTVPQGFVGYAEDKGEPVLLPPGLHQWQSPTLTMERMIDLNSSVIKLGPLTLLTVDEGYAAITQNNGKQVVLPGGDTHLLTHRNWKFEKFVSQKIETTKLDNIVTPSADNVLMQINSTVAWQIIDVERAAMTAISTMNIIGDNTAQDMQRLRYDVLKQAEASLSSFIGTVDYSDSFSHSAAVQGGVTGGVVLAAEPEPEQARNSASSKDISDTMFAGPGLISATEHANEMTAQYGTCSCHLSRRCCADLTLHTCACVPAGAGVKILSINIISAKPQDDELMRSLAQGAVAAAEARQAETAAHGRARALQVEAEGAARAKIIEAKGQAEAERIAAEGALKAAELLEQSKIAADLAKIDRTGVALGNSSKFFFGNGLSPNDLGNLVGAGIATSQ